MAPGSGAPDAAFKDLCLDAADPHRLAAFWCAALGRELAAADGGWRVAPPEGGPESLGIWVDPVPEPRTGKTRVHLDLRLPSPDVTPLLAVGATLVREPDGDVRWWVLADPDGNEFCAMPPAPPDYHLPAVERPTPFELVVDSADPEAQATWWAARTGGTARSRGGPSWWVEGAAGLPWPFWVFNLVPEPRTVKNRMHWDVVVGPDGPGALLDAGATMLRERGDGPEDVGWWVLADPEGNEFCAFLPGD
jgi:hypothetical protein